MPPGDPRVQHKQDPLQRQPIRQPPATRVAEAALDPRQQRLDPRPHSSDTIHGATAIDIPPSLTTDADAIRRQARGPFISVRVLKHRVNFRRESQESLRRAI
jgi:hypothetical protein